MSDEKKKISRATYLQAFGLYTLGRKYDEKLDEVGDELTKLLGYENRNDGDAGHIADSLWGARPFDEALKLSGIEVAED